MGNLTRYWRCGLWRLNRQPCMASHISAQDTHCDRHGLRWESFSIQSSEKAYLDSQWHVPGLSAVQQEARFKKIMTNLSRGKPA